MDRIALTYQLARHGEVFRALLADMPSAIARWKPAPEKWCALEVLCHLHDEECEDFRARLKLVLETPEALWPKIDPTAWVMERKYIDQEFNTVLERFLTERSRSVEWLRGMTDPPWTNAYMHPKVGPVSCDLLLTNWVAHDLHHLRQLIRLRYAYLEENTSVPLDYAGTW